jgi:hypothetical protein
MTMALLLPSGNSVAANGVCKRKRRSRQLGTVSANALPLPTRDDQSPK